VFPWWNDLTCQESPSLILCQLPATACVLHLLSRAARDLGSPIWSCPARLLNLKFLSAPVSGLGAVASRRQVVLAAGSTFRATWSMLMSRRPVRRARPSVEWVEWRGVSGPFSDPGGQYSHAVSAGCGVVECPWAYLGSRAVGSARWDGVLPRVSGSRVASAASPGHSPLLAASGIRSAPRLRLWLLRRATPLVVVSGLTDGSTGVWRGEEPRPAREQVVVSLVGSSCGVRVCWLPPWTQVPKPPRHPAGAAIRTCAHAAYLRVGLLIDGVDLREW
jgi:hypothetical protein